MKIERYQTRKNRTSPWLLACGCLGIGAIGIITTGIAAALVFPMLPGLILPHFGLEEVGSAEEILSEPVDAVPEIMDAQVVGSVILSTNNYEQTLDASGTDYSVIVGDGEIDMMPQMQISFTEDGMLTQCLELSSICGESGDVLRNATFDLRPNGLILNGEFELQGGVRQEAGLVMQVNSLNRFEIIGVQIGNSVFAPNNSELSNIVTQAEAEINILLSQLTARSGGASYTVSDIIIDDNRLTLVMR